MHACMHAYTTSSTHRLAHPKHTHTHTPDPFKYIQYNPEADPTVGNRPSPPTGSCSSWLGWLRSELCSLAMRALAASDCNS